MAKKPPPEKYHFKKGQSGNPSGKAHEPPEVREARKVSTHEFTKVATRYLFMTREEISFDLKRPEASMLEVLIGGIVAKAVQKQDEKLATFIFDRVIGKVTQHMEISMPQPTIIRRLDGTILELGAKVEGHEIPAVDIASSAATDPPPWEKS